MLYRTVYREELLQIAAIALRVLQNLRERVRRERTLSARDEIRERHGEWKQSAMEDGAEMLNAFPRLITVNRPRSGDMR